MRRDVITTEHSAAMYVDFSENFQQQQLLINSTSHDPRAFGVFTGTGRYSGLAFARRVLDNERLTKSRGLL